MAGPCSVLGNRFWDPLWKTKPADARIPNMTWPRTFLRPIILACKHYIISRLLITTNKYKSIQITILPHCLRNNKEKSTTCSVQILFFPKKSLDLMESMDIEPWMQRAGYRVCVNVCSLDRNRGTGTPLKTQVSSHQ